MAVLLGKEDKSIVEKSFSRNNLTIDDCNATAMDKFVVANNEHVTFEKERNKEVVGVLPPIDESGLTDLRLEEMRSLRESILESAREMRNTKKEIDGLNILAETDETIQQQITGDEMQIGENTYKLITDIQPETFEKTYESHDSNKFKKHIDLRSFFTPIKNQGNVGTCTVFAITSIYEYILKKAESKDYDLSEHFIYYNIPDSQDSKRAKGTSYNDVIGVFKSIGVCEEVTCPYDPATVDKKPSDKAYQEALLHTICEVKGVTINHDDIISALNDGYPVAISLRIFDSFCKDANGIVTTPSAEDINKANSAMYHAMVICGYSLDDSTYIVRNSWGDKVGDKGYLYIPFDYIENKDLNPSACVVTSINSGVETK
jgi:C1A family cysteine protease